MIIAMFAATTVMGYSFTIKTENVAYTDFIKKTNSTAYATATCSSLNYASAKLNYTAVKQTSLAVLSDRTALVGTGSVKVVYTTAVTTGTYVRMNVHNPASNGTITVTTTGSFNP